MCTSSLCSHECALLPSFTGFDSPLPPPPHTLLPPLLRSIKAIMRATAITRARRNGWRSPISSKFYVFGPPYPSPFRPAFGSRDVGPLPPSLRRFTVRCTVAQQPPGKNIHRQRHAHFLFYSLSLSRSGATCGHLSHWSWFIRRENPATALFCLCEPRPESWFLLKTIRLLVRKRGFVSSFHWIFCVMKYPCRWGILCHYECVEDLLYCIASF